MRRRLRVSAGACLQARAPGPRPAVVGGFSQRAPSPTRLFHFSFPHLEKLSLSWPDHAFRNAGPSALLRGSPSYLWSRGAFQESLGPHVPRLR